jgi:prepilin-type N-terminal cleavage/methylation domain-containing protein
VQPRSVESASGFSLVEVLVATALLVVGVASVAQLSGVSARAGMQARSITIASLLASQKVEQLRALALASDPAGRLITDTTTDVTVFPPTADGGSGLTPSPADSLTADRPGYCDFVDPAGRVVSAADGPPSSATYVRRWSITPIVDDAANTVVLQVLVTRYPGAGAPATDSARMVTVKTRKPM